MHDSLILSSVGIIVTVLLFILALVLFGKNKQLADTLKMKGRQIIHQLTETTRETTSELTEEAIELAVDRAIHLIQTASQRVRESRVPTENVKLEVSIKVVNLAEVKMQVDVPTTEELADANSEQKPLLPHA